MKFIVSRDVLYSNLSAISGVIGNNSSMPILENVLFSVKGNQLILTASDLENTMSAMLELSDVEGEGMVAVQAKLLIETLKLLPETPVVFAFNLEDKIVKFTAANGEYDLPCYPGEEFPQVATIADANSFEIDAAILQRAISKTLFATGTDEMRPNMTGVLCELSNENITFVATDAHKLVRYRNTKIKAQDFVSFILPKKPLAQLRSILPPSSDPILVQYSSDNNHIQFSFKNIVLFTKLKAGKFPNYEAVIPKENPNKLQISREDFLKSIKRAGIYSNQSTFQVKISLSDEKIHINAEDMDYSNKAEEDINGTYTGEPMEIAFNAKFLREILENVDSQEIILEMSSNNRAALVLPNEEFSAEETLLMLIMPVMLNY